jgi:hypothetical protein
MSVARNRRPRSPDDPRALSFSASTICARDAWIAGASPTSSAVTIVTPPVKASARQFSVRMVFGGSCGATIAWMADSAHNASSSPSPPATIEKTKLSIRNCLTTRGRVAPIAWRTAISLCRAVSRPRNSDATLAQAMRRTKLTAPMSV